MAPKHPWLTKRKSTFYLRAKVPSDIRAFYPKAEVKRSLKTTDKVTAARLIHVEAAAVEREFGEYRKRGGPPPQPSSIRRYAKRFEPLYNGFGPPPEGLISSEELTEEDIRRFALKHWAERRSSIDEPTSNLSLRERREYAADLEIDVAVASDDESHLWGHVYELAEKVLEERGFFFDRTGSKATKLLEVVNRAECEVLRQRVARLRDQPVSAPYDSYFAAAGAPELNPTIKSSGNDFRLSLNQLISRYENDPSRQAVANKTRVEDKCTFSHLREVFKGHRPIVELSDIDCQAFRDLICSLPKNARIVCRGMTAKEAAKEAASRHLPKLTAKGANKYLHKLSALMKYAIDKRLMPGPNPAHKIALPHKHTIDDRDPFSSNQLQLIFSSAKFLAFSSRRTTIGSGAAFWVPTLALFMGLRQGEACQLMAHDFDSERGVAFVKIQDDCGRRLKTENAKRKIPCHPHLLKLGLMEFVERAKCNSISDRLFPEEELGKDGHFSPFSKRFTRFLQAVGARQPKTSFHSLRHNFRDALSYGETPDDLVDALGGWKPDRASTGKRYGSRKIVLRLAQEIEKVEYPEFPLEAFVEIKHAKAQGTVVGKGGRVRATRTPTKIIIGSSDAVANRVG